MLEPVCSPGEDDRAVAIEESLEVVARPGLGTRGLGHRGQPGQVAGATGELAVPGPAVRRDHAHGEDLLTGVAVGRDIQVGRLAIGVEPDVERARPPVEERRHPIAGAILPGLAHGVAHRDGDDSSRARQAAQNNVHIAGSRGVAPVLPQPLRDQGQLLDLRERGLRHPELRVATPPRDRNTIRGHVALVGDAQPEPRSREVPVRLEEEVALLRILRILHELGIVEEPGIHAELPAHSRRCLHPDRLDREPRAEPAEMQACVLQPVRADADSDPGQVLPVLPDPARLDRYGGTSHHRRCLARSNVSLGGRVIVVAHEHVTDEPGRHVDGADPEVPGRGPLIPAQVGMPVSGERVVLPAMAARYCDVDEADLATRVEPGQREMDIHPLIGLVAIAGAHEVVSILPDPAGGQPPPRSARLISGRPDRNPSDRRDVRELGRTRPALGPRPIAGETVVNTTQKTSGHDALVISTSMNVGVRSVDSASCRGELWRRHPATCRRGLAGRKHITESPRRSDDSRRVAR